MRGKTDLQTYLKLKAQLSEICPQIEVKLISQDPKLKELGFSDYIPCEIELCGTDAQIEELEDMIFNFETDAFNTSDEAYPPLDDHNYILYSKYGWIANLIYNFKHSGRYL